MNNLQKILELQACFSYFGNVAYITFHTERLFKADIFNIQSLNSAVWNLFVKHSLCPSLSSSAAEPSLF